ncbi:ABC-F family ATP-binding cassette domain-containing protein [Treponema parvum]|uniref:ABC-F family ATP-binding cassette domain-containing protein n=1 Tax=Treponema parvum TaxID=138851 RepID=A0A975F656_9SPIR|nr:ABC-F family ATP-binding cassette domain-containing protein [Treponema parvum]QTQ15077.1 ABC-F family ATP-binding cassette domain-containing protein [Treponema parvum]
MAFVQFSQVSLAFGGRDILKNVSINLQTGSKAALTGANGAGKSTLIKVMAGLTAPDSGKRSLQKDTRIAYLPQSGLTHHGCTLMEEADKAFDFGYKIQEEIENIGENLARNDKNTKNLLERHAFLMNELESSGWHMRSATAESVLLGLGFTKEDMHKKTEEFSGGWQMRIALAKVLMQNPDILLLDEPTNYLDLEARSWLERFLQNYKGGFLLVSHDRYFLDVTINEVYELFGGNLKRYPGNFSHYEKVREVELQTLIAQYEQQQEEIQHLEDYIRRFGAKATKASQAQDRQKRLDKIIRIEIPESLKKIHFTFPKAPHAGKIVLRMNGISKTYDGKVNVLNNLDLVLENGERLVVAGYNGAGKTTLLRIISGEDKDFKGEIIPGAGVKIGYFSQDIAETIKGGESVMDFMEKESPLELIPKLRGMLGAFLFRGDDVFKSLDVLSGGEKSRLALLRLLLHPVNLLVLDEPTNHLDMHSKDVLLQALKDFGGTVVFVSHDRGFIEGLATRVLELKPGRSRNFPGDYHYYLERLEAENREAATDASNASASRAAKGASAATGAQGAKTPAASSAAELPASYEEQKALRSQKRKKENKVNNIEALILQNEDKKKQLENEMAKPEIYSNGEKCKSIQTKISEIDNLLDDLNFQWEKAMEDLEKYR